MQQNNSITNITVSGFKSLVEERSIDIRPLTLLAGANSSGKSSVMQPLLLLKQTLEATYDPGPLLLDGPNVRFTSAEQFLSHQGEQPSFSVKFVSGEAFIRSTFAQNEQGVLEVAETEYCNQEGNLILTPTTRITIEEFATKKGIIADFYEKLKAVSSGPFPDWLVRRKRCYLEAFWISTPDSDPTYVRHSPMQTYPTDILHLPGLRGNPERAYRISAVSDKFPGTFENYVASLIQHWQRTEDARLTTLISQLQTLGLAQGIQAQRLNDINVEVKIRLAEGESPLVSVADVGVGVSQVLPVLVALLAAKSGQLVYIEQPEIHLHPRAQVALAEILAAAAQRGVRVVAETHSSVLLLAIQTLVAEQKLDPALTMLHWFQRDSTGVSRISSTDLDGEGAYGDWPVDFGEVDLRLEARYLDAVEFPSEGM